jgi:DNA-binding transcriptional LysR family regulator
MLDLRDLQCLVALSRHKHFARAAEECGMSQPAFSMRIRNLEDRLQTSIVKRGNRYLGLTGDGEMILARARRVIGEARALEDEVRAAKGEVMGVLSLGVVPTVTAFAARAAQRLRESHPGIRLKILATNALEIQQRLSDGRLDAAITYSEGVSPDLYSAEPLYDERYVLLLPETLATGQNGASMTWRDAAELPLVLLEPDMQNRRIIDAVFREAGAAPDVVAESNGFIAALAMAVAGMGATVLPEALVDALGPIGATRVVPLVEPELSKSISFVVSKREQHIPGVEALRQSLIENMQ